MPPGVPDKAVLLSPATGGRPCILCGTVGRKFWKNCLGLRVLLLRVLLLRVLLLLVCRPLLLLLRVLLLLLRVLLLLLRVLLLLLLLLLHRTPNDVSRRFETTGAFPSMFFTCPNFFQKFFVSKFLRYPKIANFDRIF